MTDSATEGSGKSAAGTDPEVAAIQAVLAALSSLNKDARDRVLAYVHQRLGIAGTPQPPLAATGTSAGAAPPGSPSTAARPTDIRSFAQEKNPSSAVERAVLIAYYLAELAPESMRKTEIATSDLVTYSKQANFPVPPNPRQVLFAAKSAGYLDSAGHGSYKLNPVGHNLVVHSLPTGAGNQKTSAKKRRKQSGKKPRRPAKKRTGAKKRAR